MQLTLAEREPHDDAVCDVLSHQILTKVDNLPIEAIDATEGDTCRASVREALVEGLADAAQVEMCGEEPGWYANTSRLVHLAVIALPGIAVREHFRIDGLSSYANLLVVRALREGLGGEVGAPRDLAREGVVVTRHVTTCPGPFTSFQQGHEPLLVLLGDHQG